MNHLYNIETIFYFTKDGVLAVEMGRATQGGVELKLLFGETVFAYLALSFCYEFVLQLLQTGTDLISASRV